MVIGSLDFILEIHRGKAPPKSKERGLLSDMACFRDRYFEI